jgi:Flp pilus assembly protein TadG
MRERSTKERGIAIMITAIALVLIAFLVALAVDASFLYLTKAKLSASCDAAALAAARSLNVGMTLAAQEASAMARANAFFAANFPTGTMNSKNLAVQVVVAEGGLRTRTVQVSASVDAPTYFLKMAGYTKVPVAASGTASRRDVNLILVLDRSGSMANSNSCEPMKEAAREFVSNFAEGRDRMALIGYSSGYRTGFAPSKTFKTSSPTLDSVIAGITCTGGTSAAMAISEAYNHILAINEPGALNLILFFTDGVPTGLTASFPIKRVSDSRLGDGSSTYPSTSSSYTFPKSTCQDALGRTNTNAAWDPQNRAGVLAATGDGTATTGTTYGIYNAITASLSGNDISINGPTDSSTSRAGCSFGPDTTNLTRVRRDIAYIPNTDVYGNDMTCCYRVPSYFKFTTGPYTGFIRPDRPSSIGAAATNATDNAATRIRQDASFTPIFYVIGLGDAASPADQVLLAKIANSTTSAYYQPAQPTGMYIYAPDSTELNQAFSRIASEILRLSR